MIGGFFCVDVKPNVRYNHWANHRMLKDPNRYQPRKEKQT